MQLELHGGIWDLELWDEMERMLMRTSIASEERFIGTRNKGRLRNPRQMFIRSLDGTLPAGLIDKSSAS